MYNPEYDDNQVGVEDSVVDMEAAPNVGDLLHSDIPEDKEEAEYGLDNTEVQADTNLEGETLNQWQAEGNVEAETDAAVADGSEYGKAPLPESGVKTNVVEEQAAPSVSDDLHSDIPESKADASRGLENTSAQAANNLEADSIVQWVAEGDAEAVTDAAVADGLTEPHPGKTVGEELEDPDTGVKINVVEQEAAPSVSDQLHSDIPESKADAARGLENTSAQAANNLEADSIVQWVAEGDAEAVTDAAVADGQTEPHPAETVGEAAEDLDY